MKGNKLAIIAIFLSSISIALVLGNSIRKPQTYLPSLLSVEQVFEHLWSLDEGKKYHVFGHLVLKGDFYELYTNRQFAQADFFGSRRRIRIYFPAEKLDRRCNRSEVVVSGAIINSGVVSVDLITLISQLESGAHCIGPHISANYRHLSPVTETGLKLSDIRFRDQNLARCVSAHDARFVDDLSMLGCGNFSISDISGLEKLTALTHLGLKLSDHRSLFLLPKDNVLFSVSLSGNQLNCLERAKLKLEHPNAIFSFEGLCRGSER